MYWFIYLVSDFDSILMKFGVRQTGFFFVLITYEYTYCCDGFRCLKLLQIMGWVDNSFIESQMWYSSVYEGWSKSSRPLVLFATRE